MTAVTGSPGRSDLVIVLRSELGATTCHVPLAVEIPALLRGERDGVELRFVRGRPEPATRWFGGPVR